MRPLRTGAASGDIVRSYLGQLVQATSDFDPMENLLDDKFFKQAVGICLPLSSPMLRQPHLIPPEYELDGWTATLPERTGPVQVVPGEAAGHGKADARQPQSNQTGAAATPA